ncbi:MAG: N-acetylmuramoyl-L-alanine amidase [Chloroflexi bacterium]|nr:N-acetylmuramoyl-L-alanine amidase [Chloroflexota bacterium]
MNRQAGGHASAAYEDSLGAVPIALRLVVVVSCVAAIGATIYGLREPSQPGNTAPQVIPPLATATTQHDQPTPLPPGSPVEPSAVPPATPPHVGIVSGHWGNDTGAVCPDGLTEAEINLDVARRVVYLLQSLGYQVDLLEELDPRLDEYQADALVSIHADSCASFPDATPPASGFKVASVEDSAAPEAEERLVACLAQCYATRTGMYFHANSITYDMTRYHTFYEVDDRTPAAIIETGFMLNDRHILTQRADLVAQGIVDGIVCFIESEGP